MLNGFTPIHRTGGPPNQRADFGSDDDSLAISDNEFVDESFPISREPTPPRERLQTIMGRLEEGLSELPSLSQFNFQANLFPAEISNLPDLSHLSFNFSNHRDNL